MCIYRTNISIILKNNKRIEQLKYVLENISFCNDKIIQKISAILDMHVNDHDLKNDKEDGW